MTKHRMFVYVICLLFSLTLVAAGNGITPDEKASSPPSKVPALAASHGTKKATAQTTDRPAAKATVASAPAQKTKRRSKQVIIVIVVDDQESSWI